MNNVITNAIKTGGVFIIGVYAMKYTLDYINHDCEKQKEKREQLQKQIQIHTLAKKNVTSSLET